MRQCKNHPLYDKKALEEKHRKSTKTLKGRYKRGEIKGAFNGKHHNKQTRLKLRLKTIERIKSLKGEFRCNYNQKAISFFDSLSEKMGWNLRHAENGGEFYSGIGYWLDAYDENLKIAVEYDEPYHYDDVENNVLREKDILRQKEIIEHLNCEFYRYNESTGILWKVS